MALQIMVPLDGSTFAESAITYAADIARHAQGTIHLVRVHQMPDEDRLGDALYIDGAALDERWREEDRAYLAALTTDVRLADIETRPALLMGEVVHSLRQYAASCSIELIVMSTHGRGGLTRAWLGSVADGLVRGANTPVLLLRPVSDIAYAGEQHFSAHSILIPIDGSEFSESIIETAIGIGGKENVHYTLLQILMPPPAVGMGDGVPLPVSADASDEVRRAAEDHIHTVRDDLRTRGYTVDAVVTVNPDVSTTIRDFAAEIDADLIAMVTHGHSGWRRFVLGSVTDTVMRSTTVPLLVLKPYSHAQAVVGT